MKENLRIWTVAKETVLCLFKGRCTFYYQIRSRRIEKEISRRD